jgi:hypothetical protein
VTIGTVLWFIYWLGFGVAPGLAYRWLARTAWMASTGVLAVLAFVVGIFWPFVALVMGVMWVRERVRRG